ncbi:MAG: mechanosensitive ion channel family protein [Sphaerochaetaceae bacterium]
MDLQNILNLIGNVYIRALAIIVVSFIVLIFVNAFLRKRIRDLESGKNEKALNNKMILPIFKVVGKVILPLIFLLFFYIAIKQIPFDERLNNLIGSLLTIVVTVMVIRSINKVIEISFSKYLDREPVDQQELEHAKSIKPLLSLIKFVVWILGIIFLLANLGLDVSTAIAGLGVGGIAVAIAAQGVLGDLFAYFVIFFDKPFILGEFIAFGDKSGVVEKIGVKSTQIRVLSGEILVISNSELVNSKVHNYKKMQRRRIVLNISVPFETDPKKVKKIPTLIKEAIANVKVVDGVAFDRSHLQSIGSYAIKFETVFYVPSPDYTVYMDVQQEIYLNILDSFNKEEIKFAYPTEKHYTFNS